MRIYRTTNVARVLGRVEKRLEQAAVDVTAVHVHPRLAIAVLEESSKTDDDVLQEMWAGLLVSSAQEQPDDEGLLFTSLLSQLTRVEARILSYACEHSEKNCNALGLVGPSRTLRVPLEDLRRIPASRTSTAWTAK